MNLSKMLGLEINDILNTVGNIAGDLFTSDEERIAFKQKLKELELQRIKESSAKALKIESYLTKRWMSDNEHFLTRLVRPAMVVWAFFLFTVVVLADGNLGAFVVNEAYIPSITTVVNTVVLAYFGSRGAEKIMKVYKD
jgi:hypothetical protein